MLMFAKIVLNLGRQEQLLWFLEKFHTVEFSKKAGF
jgi:hypothetical protein